MALFVHAVAEPQIAASRQKDDTNVNGFYQEHWFWVSSVSGDFSMKKLYGFIKNDDGLVAIEWVGIAAVMLVSAIAIAGAVMTGAFNAGDTVATGAETMAAGANAPDLPDFSGE